MFETMTYEALLEGMLEKALERNGNLDTREGSMAWYGSAPAAAELQNLYIYLDAVLRETFADTASRYYLMKRAAERGMSPYPAACAVRLGEFTPVTLKLPEGTRFSIETVNYKSGKQEAPGKYQMICETAGEIGNRHSGALVPVEYVRGLETAALSDILIPGEEEEETEAFRQRYLDSLDSQAFGGNVADYKAKVNAIPGVGGVKVFRAWNGGIHPSLFLPPDGWENSARSAPPETRAWMETVASAASDGLLTVGGTVRLVIIGADWKPPSPLLLESVQTAVDPQENHGEGLGLAPIGHFVTVRGVEEKKISVTLHLTLENRYTFEDLRPSIGETIDGYFRELSSAWAEQPSQSSLIVRVSALEMRLLVLPGIIDLEDTLIDGQGRNLVLGENEIPVRGEIIGQENT